MKPESPIEQDILSALQQVSKVLTVEDASRDEVARYAKTPTYHGILIVAPQVKIARYRVDFIVGLYTPATGYEELCVECDGYHFHRANKDQKDRDAKRDDDLYKLGLRTHRIPGHEIHKDHYAAGYDILEVLTNGRLGRGRVKRRSEVILGDTFGREDDRQQEW